MERHPFSLAEARRSHVATLLRWRTRMQCGCRPEDGAPICMFDKQEMTASLVLSQCFSHSSQIVGTFEIESHWLGVALCHIFGSFVILLILIVILTVYLESFGLLYSQFKKRKERKVTECL